MRIYRKFGQFEPDDRNHAETALNEYLVNRIEYHPVLQKVVRDVQFDTNGEVQQKTVMEYDDSGFMTSELLIEADGGVLERKTFEPDEKSRIRKEYIHYADGSYDMIEYHYNASGQITKKVQSDNDGVVEHSVEYEYNNGHLVAEVSFDEEGTMISETTYEYDEDGLLDEKAIYHIGDNEKLVQSYVYNDEGYREAIFSTDSSGQLIEKFLFTLDEKGRPVGVVEENRQKKNRITMEYDEKDHVILQEEVDLRGELVSKVRRYYDHDGLFLKSEVTARNPVNGIIQQYEVMHVYEFFDE